MRFIRSVARIDVGLNVQVEDPITFDEEVAGLSHPKTGLQDCGASSFITTRPKARSLPILQRWLKMDMLKMRLWRR